MKPHTHTHTHTHIIIIIIIITSDTEALGGGPPVHILCQHSCAQTLKNVLGKCAQDRGERPRILDHE